MSESLAQGLALIGAQQYKFSFPDLPSMTADLVSKSDLNFLTSFSPSSCQHLWHNGVVTLKLHFFCHGNLHISNDSTPCTSASPPASLPPSPLISLQAFAEPVGLNNDKCALHLRLQLSAHWEFGGGPHTHLIYNLRHWNQLGLLKTERL